MKKRSPVIAGVLLVVLAAVGWHVLRSVRAPAGQPPVVFLAAENFSQIRTVFNEASGSVRIVLLLSPT